MFLASLLGFLGMSAHESYTTTPEYLRRKNPEYFARRDAYQAECEKAKAKELEQRESANKWVEEFNKKLEGQRKEWGK